MRHVTPISCLAGSLLLGMSFGCSQESTADSSHGALRLAGEAEPEELTLPADLDCPPGPVGEIRIEIECDSFTVWSCRELSNVVIEYEDGSRERFEELSGNVGSFSGTGEHEGKAIVRVWVKAGGNSSGDGPGYGTRFEAPIDACGDEAGRLDASTPEPEEACGLDEDCGPQIIPSEETPD